MYVFAEIILGKRFRMNNFRMGQLVPNVMP